MKSKGEVKSNGIVRISERMSSGEMGKCGEKGMWICGITMSGSHK